MILRKLGNYFLSKNRLPFDGYSEDFLHTAHVHQPKDDPAWAAAVSDVELRLLRPFGRHYSSQWRSSIYAQLLMHSIARSPTQVEVVEAGLELGKRLITALHYIELKSPSLLEKVTRVVAYDSFDGWHQNSLTEVERSINPSNARIWNRAITPDSLASIYATILSPETLEKLVIVEGWLPDSLTASTNVSFLSLDLNYVVPEIRTFQAIRTSLSADVTVLLDDFSTSRKYEAHWTNWNKVASDFGTEIICLPTGQGIFYPSTPAER